MKIFTNLLVILILFVQAYSIASAAGWEEMATLENPTNLPTIAAADGKIYIVSGTLGANATTFEFDPATNTWSKKAPIPFGQYWSTAETINDKIYVCGGGSPYPGSKYLQIYDPKTNNWSQGAELLTGRMYHSSGVANGKIYLVGGQNGDGTSEWYFEEYDPMSNSWASKGNIPHNNAWYSGVVGMDKKLYRIGGGRSTVPMNYVDVYDTETEKWTIEDPFPIGIHGPAALALDGKVYVLGGYNGTETLDSIYTYSPSSKIWNQSVISLPEPMSYCKAVVLGNYIYAYKKSEDGQYGHLWRFKFGTSGVKDIDENSDINLFPNPSNGEFTINIKDKAVHNVDLEIYSSIGVSVYSSKNESVNGTISINLTQQPQGLYFIKIIADSKTIFKSVIIK
jgi:N-acetylneuraminic acid mutarotase